MSLCYKADYSELEGIPLFSHISLPSPFHRSTPGFSGSKRTTAGQTYRLRGFSWELISTPPSLIFIPTISQILWYGRKCPHSSVWCPGLFQTHLLCPVNGPQCLSLTFCFIFPQWYRARFSNSFTDLTSALECDTDVKTVNYYFSA